MPTPKPLTPQQAAHTLAQRFAPRADRLRQLATRFGIRSYRCWLVWTKDVGDEVGSGRTSEVKRMEVLPTPKVRHNLYRSLINPGVVPAGSVELTEVSALLTIELLTGRIISDPDDVGVPPPYEFHWELREDGRAGDQPPMYRYRVLGEPQRDPGNVQWKLTLAPISDE